jgi:hypothetical protein
VAAQLAASHEGLSSVSKKVRKEFSLDGIKKLQQRSHKCVELRGEYVE